MAWFRRRPELVEVWQVPLWGRPAAEDLPSWLLSRMQSEEIIVNSLGGFTRPTAFGSDGCAAGDYVLRYEDDTIEFCSADRFMKRCEPLSNPVGEALPG